MYIYSDSCRSDDGIRGLPPGRAGNSRPPLGAHALREMMCGNPVGSGFLPFRPSLSLSLLHTCEQMCILVSYIIYTHAYVAYEYRYIDKYTCVFTLMFAVGECMHVTTQPVQNMCFRSVMASLACSPHSEAATLGASKSQNMHR